MEKVVLWITGTTKPVLTLEQDKEGWILIETTATDYVKIKAMENLTNAINKLRGKLK
jgi:hypothetical protein